MDIFNAAEKLMSMDEASWQRHANPWSVYSRFSCLPLITLAVWSRSTLEGSWLALLALALLWTWLNPRVFSPPASTDNWAAKGTFGERIFLRRKTLDIPAHHLRAAKGLALLSALGLPILLYGFYSLNIWALICGNIVVILPKLWFVDRMVWLYSDLKDSDPEFTGWLK